MISTGFRAPRASHAPEEGLSGPFYVSPSIKAPAYSIALILDAEEQTVCTIHGSSQQNAQEKASAICELLRLGAVVQATRLERITGMLSTLEARHA